MYLISYVEEENKNLKIGTIAPYNTSTIDRFEKDGFWDQLGPILPINKQWKTYFEKFGIQLDGDITSILKKIASEQWEDLFRELGPEEAMILYDFIQNSYKITASKEKTI